MNEREERARARAREDPTCVIGTTENNIL